MRGGPVLIVSYSGVLGGAERVLLDCVQRLDGEVVVACPDGPLATALRESGLGHAPLPERTLRLRAAHARAIGALARDVAALARRHRPVAIAAWGARAVLATALLPRSRRPPVLAVHHDVPPRHGVRGAVRSATRRADGVVAASAPVAAATAPGRRVVLLHPGVDLEAWRPAPLPAGPPRALVLAPLVPGKRQDLALEVAARIPELRLELAGAPLASEAFARALRARASRPDLAERVTFLGPLDDPRPALARSHCLLHCADAEPWGLALLEALASGRPVVAAGAPGPREIVGGSAGRLFPAGDADAAAAAVRAVLADPDAPAAARARAARFPVAESAARFAAALEEIAG